MYTMCVLLPTISIIILSFSILPALFFYFQDSRPATIHPIHPIIAGNNHKGILILIPCCTEKTADLKI